MRKSLLSTVFELVGFAAVGLLFFVWFVGHKKNNVSSTWKGEETITAEAGLGMDKAPERRTIFDEPIKVSKGASKESYKKKKQDREPIEVYEASVNAPRPTVKKEKRRAAAEVVVRKASAIRNWKGVHRDEQFSWNAYTRFAEDVAELSDQYGLYPEVFMARIIAYSYDFVADPNYAPADNNMTAMRSPKTKDRAMFKSVEESLKAYAVVNAGEIKKLSADGAIAKFDRSWTVRKIIEKYSFINELSKETRNHKDYAGLMGSASRISEEEAYDYELEGEAIRMVSTVEEKVRKNKATEKGFDTWQDYLEDLPEEEQAKVEQEAQEETSAVSRKKAHQLGRRVDGKQRKRKN